MSKQYDWIGEIRYKDNLLKKVLEVDKEETEDVRVEFEDKRIIFMANSISKFRGLVNSYLRLMKLILEVEEIGRRRKDN